MKDNKTCITDEFFEELKLNKEKIEASWKYVISKTDKALTEGNVDELLKIKEFIESSEGSYAFNNVGECQRLYRILCIVKIEIDSNLSIFVSDCHTYDELMTKYMLVVFSLRRLNFELSESSQEEALIYLKNSGISCVAIWIIVNNDLVVPYEYVYDKISHVFSEVWSDIEIQLYENLRGKRNG